ncbi:pseudouridine synthase pus4 [Spiromyces aspiralis]|uniref:Pseudouridine synthase pus4 n=1 Tax=Spiromyces aspiralis TaxID=68401 RepID=A0ACC1HQY3_9FUNG|nr:pseudouridine synthase pus4 [Spiromyces aspiralis]
MDGKPLHHYVRNKLEFPRPVEPRLVNVKSLELLSFQPGHGRDFSTAGIGQGRNGPKVGDSARCLFEAAGTATRDHELTTFKLGVVCGGGTYVRSLISDIAEEVGTRGFVSGLVRTRQGPFELGKHTIEMGELSDPDRIVEVMKAASQLAIESNLP